MPLSDLEISEDESPIAGVKTSKALRDHGIGGLGKSLEASSPHPSFHSPWRRRQHSSYGSKRSSRVSQATDRPSIGIFSPEKGLGVWSIGRRPGGDKGLLVSRGPQRWSDPG